MDTEDGRNNVAPQSSHGQHLAASHQGAGHHPVIYPIGLLLPPSASQLRPNYHHAPIALLSMGFISLPFATSFLSCLAVVG